MKKEWWQEKRTCLKCGSQMEPGALPGYFNCRKCKLWIDIQEWEGNAIVQYHENGIVWSLPVSVPEDVLLVLSWVEA